MEFDAGAGGNFDGFGDGADFQGDVDEVGLGHVHFEGGDGGLAEALHGDGGLVGGRDDVDEDILAGGVGLLAAAEVGGGVEQHHLSAGDDGAGRVAHRAGHTGGGSGLGLREGRGEEKQTHHYARSLQAPHETTSWGADGVMLRSVSFGF